MTCVCVYRGATVRGIRRQIKKITYICIQNPTKIERHVLKLHHMELKYLSMMLIESFKALATSRKRKRMVCEEKRKRRKCN